MKTLKIIGDSILKGVVYSPTGRRYSLCQECRAEQLSNDKVQVVNLSKFGATVREGLKTLDSDRTPTDRDTAVILEFAGNDCNFDWNKISENPGEAHTPKTTPEDFVRLLREGIRKIKEKGAKAVIALAPPIVAERFFSFISGGNDPERIMQWLESKDALYRRQEYYTVLAANLARAEGCEVLDLRAPFLVKKDIAPYLCADGSHPNAQGHRLICDQVKGLMDRL